MGCKCAKPTDQYHGWKCEITDGECMFLIPDSKACAEKYGEGPDTVTEFEDNITKYECRDCENQFILGDTATENTPPRYPVCPYCGQSDIEGIAFADTEKTKDMGCMAIWTQN